MKKLGGDFDTMGIVRTGHHLAWGYQCGWLGWTPLWFRGFIIHIWNEIACRLFGHDTFDGTCVACCKEGLDDYN